MPAIDRHDRPPLLEVRALAYARNDEAIFGPLDFVAASQARSCSSKATTAPARRRCCKRAVGTARADVGRDPAARRAADARQAVAAGRAARASARGSRWNSPRCRTCASPSASAASARASRPATALAGVGLEGYEDEPLRQLSAGQKKRVALARAAARAGGAVAARRTVRESRSRRASTWSTACSRLMRAAAAPR